MTKARPAKGEAASQVRAGGMLAAGGSRELASASAPLIRTNTRSCGSVCPRVIFYERVGGHSGSLPTTNVYSTLLEP